VGAPLPGRRHVQSQLLELLEQLDLLSLDELQLLPPLSLPPQLLPEQ